MSCRTNLYLRDETISFLEDYITYVKQLGISYVGYREFYSDGTSKAFCSNNNWYNIDASKDMSIHYLQELLNIKRNQHNYVVRSAYNAHNPFLQKLKESDMCNSLIIYKRENNVIKLFSFIAKITDSQIVNSFLNELSTFNDLVESYNQGLENIFKKEIYDILKKPLIPPEMAVKIFKNNLIVRSTGDKIKLTPQAQKYLSYLSCGYSNKRIANDLNITEKTVEYYFQAMKKKFQVNSRHQLIEIYKDLLRTTNSI